MEKYFCTSNHRFNYFQFDENGKIDFWFTPDTGDVCNSTELLWYKPEELTPITHDAPVGIGQGHLENLANKSRKTGTSVHLEEFSRPDKKVEVHITLNESQQFIAVGQYAVEAYEKAARVAYCYA